MLVLVRIETAVI